MQGGRGSRWAVEREGGEAGKRTRQVVEGHWMAA